MESAKLRKIVLLAGAVAATAASAGSLPSDGLQVHFRADDQAALNNGAGAGQWEEVTNWQGGGVAAPLLKRVVAPNGTLRNVPHFVTNGFARTDGTVSPALRFCVNENGTGRASAVSVLASDAMQFGFTGTDYTWFFAFNGIPNSEASMNWKGYWGMADATANGYYLGLATRNNNSGKSVFYAWGGADTMGTSLIASSVDVEAGRRLIDVRGRYKKAIATGYMNGEQSTAHDWVATLAQPVDCRLAFGNANDSLEGDDVWGAAPMDVGELAIYNRALNDAECVIVREALTARWGLPTANILYTGASGGWCDELVGIGSSTATGSGKIAGAVETSASSRGLTLAVTAGALDGADGYVFAAACSGGSSGSAQEEGLKMTRTVNTWRIEKAALETWPDLALFFDPSGYDIASRVAERPAKVALLKLSNGAFEVVSGVTATYDADSGTLAFGCPTGTLADGVYTVGVADATGMTVIIR